MFTSQVFEFLSDVFIERRNFYYLAAAFAASLHLDLRDAYTEFVGNKLAHGGIRFALYGSSRNAYLERITMHADNLASACPRLNMQQNLC